MEISSEHTQNLLGPEPAPTLLIDMAEIKNELQAKMVEEIICTMCNKFPYEPKECKSCNKLFCHNCQLEILSQKSFADDYLSYGSHHRSPKRQQQACCPNCSV